MQSRLQLSAVCDDELLRGLSSLGAQLSHLLHDVHAVPHPAEGHVFEVQVFGFLQGDEELGVVGVPPAVCHRQDARPRVPNVKVLVLKLAAVDGRSSSAVAVGDVTALEKRTNGELQLVILHRYLPRTKKNSSGDKGAPNK